MDLVSIGRVRRAMATSPRFKELIFAAEEIAVADQLHSMRQPLFFAGRFAVKEAVLKALGCGISDGIDLRDIVTTQRPSGAPDLYLRATALKRAQSMAALNVHVYRVTLTHEADLACAMVLLT